MIRSKSDYLEYLAEDKFALGYPDEIKRPRWHRDWIWRFQRLMRRLEYDKNCRNTIFWKPDYFLCLLRFKNLSVKLGFTIAPNVFGKGLSIAHYGTIVVNDAAKIGNYCRLHAGVNIGTEAGFSCDAPTIGNCVYIGPGAKVFGGIHIGDGVAIGANAVVNKDVPSNVSVGGIPAKVISEHGAVSREHPLLLYR